MTVRVGEQAQAVAGTWSGNPSEFTYQWYVSDSGVGSGTPLVGYTRSDFTPGFDLVGKYIRAGVVASNSAGSSAELFTAYEVVEQYVPPPAYQSRSVSLLSGVKSTTSDSTSNVADVDKGWSNWV